MAKIKFKPGIKEINFDPDNFIIYERKGVHIIRMKKNKKQKPDIDTVPLQDIFRVITPIGKVKQ